MQTNKDIQRSNEPASKNIHSRIIAVVTYKIAN